jgi:hypothetical protein
MASERRNHIDVQLTPDEALVLFAFLSRYSDSAELRIEDQAEQRALWNLCCLLEKQLVEPFEPNCLELLQSARNRLRDHDDCNNETDGAPNGGSAKPLGDSGASSESPLVS